MRQSRIAARHGSRTRNSKGLTGNEGRSRAARFFGNRKKFSCVRQETRNLLCSVIPKSESTTDSLSWDSSLDAPLINSSFLACPARSVSSQQILLYSSFFGNLLRDFLGRVHSSLPTLHTNLSSPFEPHQPIDSPVVAVIVGFQTRD